MTPLHALLLLASLPAQEPAADATLMDLLAAGEDVRVDGVLFLMNDEVITESMVSQDVRRLAPIYPEKDDIALFSDALSARLYSVIALEGFNRLGLDHALMAEQVTARIQEMIEEAGSRARFEATFLRANGYDMNSFRSALESNGVEQAWRQIVTGQQPSPLEGRRNQVIITPEEIREAYEKEPERWKQDKSLVWVTLQFFDSDAGTGLERARATIAQLKTKAITLEAAKAGANSQRQDRGDPQLKNLRADLQDFLLGAQEGDVSDIDPIQGLGAQFVVLEKILEAREIGFAEAQGAIAAALRAARFRKIENEAMSELTRTSYVWYPPGLNTFMSSVPGLTKPVEETEL